MGYANGKPMGVQLITSRYREDVGLMAAASIEARLGVLTRELWSREP